MQSHGELISLANRGRFVLDKVVIFIDQPKVTRTHAPRPQCRTVGGILGTLWDPPEQRMGWKPFDPFGSTLSQQENPCCPAAVCASGRRVRRGRAVSAGRLIARLRRPWHRGSRRRCDAEQYSDRARQMADGRRTSALSANPPGFRAHRRFPVGRPISTRIRTRPRAAVGSARAITPTYPCLGARRSFLGT